MSINFPPDLKGKLLAFSVIEGLTVEALVIRYLERSTLDRDFHNGLVAFEKWADELTAPLPSDTTSVFAPVKANPGTSRCP